MTGEIRLTPDAYEWGEQWYNRHWDNPPPHLNDDRFGGYLARKQTHIHKLAIVLAAARGSRLQITAEILATARRALATTSASELSLRAVARELGMASSAVYRYVASRDELLTALIIDSYDRIGSVAERADAAALAAGHDPGRRLLEVARAVRRWAVRHRHEWALVYGSPVVGYAAPPDTVEPATRLARVIAAISQDAVAAGLVAAPAQSLPEPRLPTAGVLAIAGGPPPAPYEDFIERSLTLWMALVGAISFDLFGHLENVVTDHDAFFDAALAVVAAGVGLSVPLGPDPAAERPVPPARRNRRGS
jgi:AcrR family transcriptional regulator